MQSLPGFSSQKTHGKSVRGQKKRQDEDQADDAGRNSLLPDKTTHLKKGLSGSPQETRRGEVSDTMHQRKTSHQDTELPPQTHQYQKERHPEKSGQRTQKENDYQKIPGHFSEVPLKGSQCRKKKREKHKRGDCKQKTLHEKEMSRQHTKKQVVSQKPECEQSIDHSLLYEEKSPDTRPRENRPSPHGPLSAFTPASLQKPQENQCQNDDMHDSQQQKKRRFHTIYREEVSLIIPHLALPRKPPLSGISPPIIFRKRYCLCYS